jgi:anti-sigma factor RsiW
MTQDPNHLSHEQVSAFIDGELSSSDVTRLDQHLTACHSCAMRVVSAMQLKAATTRASERFVAPPDALSRLTQQIRPVPPQKTKRLDPFRSWPWVALAASLILAASLMGWREIRKSNTLTAELLDQHLAVLSSGASPQVISTDRHTVKPWFQGKLPFSFNLPDALPAGATLKGADLTFLHGQPAALLLFTIGKHQVSVFITQSSFDERALLSPKIQSGFVIQSANTHDLRITAVSDVNPSDLALLVSALMQAQ